MSIESPWMTTQEAADYAKRHVATISAALRNGELAGSQPMKKGKWLVHRDEVDAWIARHQSPRPRRQRIAS